MGAICTSATAGTELLPSLTGGKNSGNGADESDSGSPGGNFNNILQGIVSKDSGGDNNLLSNSNARAQSVSQGDDNGFKQLTSNTSNPDQSAQSKGNKLADKLANKKASQAEANEKQAKNSQSADEQLSKIRDRLSDSTGEDSSSSSVQDAMEKLKELADEGDISLDDVESMSDEEFSQLSSWLMSGAQGTFTQVDTVAGGEAEMLSAISDIAAQTSSTETSTSQANANVQLDTASGSSAVETVQAKLESESISAGDKAEIARLLQAAADAARQAAKAAAESATVSDAAAAAVSISADEIATPSAAASAAAKSNVDAQADSVDAASNQLRTALVDAGVEDADAVVAMVTEMQPAEMDELSNNLLQSARSEASGGMLQELAQLAPKVEIKDLSAAMDDAATASTQAAANVADSAAVQADNAANTLTQASEADNLLVSQEKQKAAEDKKADSAGVADGASDSKAADSDSTKVSEGAGSFAEEGFGQQSGGGGEDGRNDASAFDGLVDAQSTAVPLAAAVSDSSADAASTVAAIGKGDAVGQVDNSSRASSQAATQASTQSSYVDHAENMERITAAIKQSNRNGMSSVSIQLTPDNLGKVEVQVSMRQGVAVATLRTETPEAMQALAANVNDLKQTMTAQGITLGGFEVMMNGSGHQQGDGSEFSRQHNRRQQQGNSEAEPVQASSFFAGDSAWATTSVNTIV